MTEIAMIGSGYVGLVSGACLADFGNTVICVDIDKDKILRLIKGEIPIYEPGLQDLFNKNTAIGRLKFSSSLEEAVKQSTVIFIAVGTPQADDGSADLSFVEDAARGIGKVITEYKVIVDKSTVPVGTGQKVKQWIQEEIDTRIKHRELDDSPVFDIVSNPEFLREGSAIQEFTHPDRIVIGAETEKACAVMKNIYRALYLNDTPYIETNIESAEMIKYAANAFLAVKITFINEIANLCESVGANISDVAKAVGRDGRIGGKFLHPGPGYGGSCFPKDTRALACIGQINNNSLSIVDAVIKANEAQKQRMVNKIISGMNGDVNHKKIAVLGLAFKTNTDDVREAPSLFIIRELVRHGAVINATDPQAIPNAKVDLNELSKSVFFFNDEYEAIKGTDALVLVTEWNQYRNLDFDRVRQLLTQPVFFDLRNIYNRRDVETRGFQYFAVGQ
ncbi:UDP-glucose 6-dehydrogenase [Spirochaetia bacterium]|nr:UDP-glucose 6-dehydrogenase [Spirochaetia bacterium]